MTNKEEAPSLTILYFQISNCHRLYLCCHTARLILYRAMERLAHRVFVYGTLKRGQPNYFRLQDTANGVAKFLGEARLSEKYPLVVASKYSIPMLLDKPGTGEEVFGEVFQVDDKMLSHLDWIENHPDLYLRTSCKCHMLRSGSTGENLVGAESVLDCEMYLVGRFKPELLKLPFISSYSSSSDENKCYKSREHRDSGYSLMDAVKIK